MQASFVLLCTALLVQFKHDVIYCFCLLLFLNEFTYKIIFLLQILFPKYSNICLNNNIQKILSK